MKRVVIIRPAAIPLLFAVALMMPWRTAHAVPAFARQTGMPCNTCHTVFPELTPFGREFKLRGYTLSPTKNQAEGLQEAALPPLSAMIQASLTSLKKKQPDTQNDNVQLPDQLSLFFAGRVSDKVGTFVQLTYDGVEDHFSLDNTDLRFADVTAGNTIYGVTLHNNPTVQDPWNSTPAWRFPYVSSGSASQPAAATQLDGPLAQQVSGLGAYALWNRWLYGELSVYRSSQIGQNQPPDSSNEDVIEGVAPYWRLAAQHDWGAHAVEVGTYGLRTKLFPGGGVPLRGPTNRFKDYAFDAQYQYITEPHIITLHTSWILEDQDWDAAFPLGGVANTSDTLKTLRVDASYFHRRRFGGTLALFNTSGDRDPLLYQPESVDGSRTGRPDSRGWIAELDYLPRLNTKFAAQYTAYNQFNGASSNYDGSGRDAADNNTLYFNVWLAF